MQSAELRWLIVSHLNELEAVFSGWLHSVADREMIEQQFSGFVNPIAGDLPGDYLAERFRNASRVDLWPATSAFVDHYRKTHSNLVKEKNALPS